jgi:hypothetical protein
MRSHWLFPAIMLAVFAAAAPLSGQSAVVNTLQNKAALLPVTESGEQIPPGTVIPVLLETTLDSRRGKAGQRVVATIGQTISLGGNRVILVRSKLLGEVTEVSGDSGRVTLAVRFDRLLPRKSKTPLPLDVLLRAVASPMAVDDTSHTTTVGIGWNNPAAVWTTVQIGGDVVYRGGGPVVNSFGETVGEPVHGGLFNQWSGVLARVSSPAGSACQNFPSSGSPQSVWIFSANACGVYGLGFQGMRYENLANGEIVFSAPQRVKIPGGSAFLLTVAGRTPSALAAEQ